MIPSAAHSDTSSLVAQVQSTELSIIPSSKKRAPLIRRSDSEWLRIYKELEERGETLAEYCTPRKMSPSSFSAKRKVLLEKYHIANILNADIDSIEQKESAAKNKASSTKQRGAQVLRSSHQDLGNDKGVTSDNQPRYIRVVVDGRVVVEIPADLDPNLITALIVKLRQDCQD